MATETIVPNAGGDTGAAAAPAGGESVTTSSSPAVESTSAAAEAPVEITGPAEEESSAAFLTRAMGAKKAAEKPAEAAVAEEEVKVDPLADPAKVAEAAKTPEEEAAAKKAADEAAAAAVTEEEDAFEMEPVGPLPPSELAAKLKENPELAAMLEKSGIKDNIFAASRLATRVAQYEEIFPDVESAKYSAQAAADFGQLAEKFTDIKDTESARAFMQALMPFSYVLDEQGQPVMDAQGQPSNDGSVGNFLNEMLGMVLDYQAGIAKEKGDEDLQAAVDTLKARTRGSASAEEEQMTEAQKKEAARLKAERESITQERTEAAQKRSQEFEMNVAKDIESEVDKSIDKVLSKAELTDYNKAQLMKDIKEAVFAKVAARKDFFMQRDALMRRPISDAVRKERLALATRCIAPILPVVMRELLTKAGVKMQQQQQAKQEKSAAREQQNRSEQRGAGRTASPAARPTDQQIHADAIKEFTEKNHREPSTTEMLIAVADRKRKLGN